MRGAERSFAAMCDLYPNAPVATLLYDEGVFRDRLEGHAVSTSWIQRFGVNQSISRNCCLCFHTPLVHRRSEVTSWCCPAPARLPMACDQTRERYTCATATRRFGIPGTSAMQGSHKVHPTSDHWWYSLDKIRQWDLRVAQRYTHYIANGLLTQKRMREFWVVTRRSSIHLWNCIASADQSPRTSFWWWASWSGTSR